MSKIKKGSYLSRIVSQKDRIKWKYKLLKQENKQLKDEIEGYKRVEEYSKGLILTLQDRIDKAVEYIEDTYIGSILEVHCGEEEEYTEPLLDILKGVKDE